MKKTTFLAAGVGATLLILAIQASAQQGGGKATDPAAKPATKTSTKPASSATTAPKSKPTRSAATRGPAASIDGKWWTSGNDFGDSEVVFTQNGIAKIVAACPPLAV